MYYNSIWAKVELCIQMYSEAEWVKNMPQK